MLCVRGVVVHHTKGRGDPYDIARGHTLDRGWPGIAYHFVIMGGPGASSVFQTLPLDMASYHAGLHNRTRIGIAIVGDYDRGKPYPNDLHACAWLCGVLCLALDLKDPADWVGPVILPGRVVAGHRELFGATTKIGKTCPGKRFNMNELRELTALRMIDIGATDALDHGIRFPQGD